MIKNLLGKALTTGIIVTTTISNFGVNSVSALEMKCSSNNVKSHSDNIEIKILGIPYIPQSDIIFGCEPVSATMILNSLGYTINQHDFTKNYLIQRDILGSPFKNNLQGPDPNSAYPGNPYRDRWPNCGFGCYAPALVKSMNNYFKDNQNIHKAVNTTGKTLKDLVNLYINKNIPVLIWATMDMKPSSPGRKWKINYVDENSKYKIGDTYTWLKNEHCLVLVGYDSENYWFNDPYKNHGLIKYSKNLVEKRFNEMGSQSCVVIKSELPLA